MVLLMLLLIKNKMHIFVLPLIMTATLY